MIYVFNGTITLGTVVTVLFVIGSALALIFTVRAKTVGVWRENYEGEKEGRLRVEKLLADEQKEHAVSEAALIVAKQLADLTPILTELARFHEEFSKRELVFAEILGRQDKQRERTESAVQEVRESITKAEQQILDQLASIANAQTVSAGIQERIVNHLEALEGNHERP